MIVEGSPEDPREMEADIDYFMKHAKVPQWPQALRRSLLRGAHPLYLLLASAPAHFGFQSALCSPLWALSRASLNPQEAVFSPPLHDAFYSLAYLLPVSLCHLSLHSISAAVSRWS